MKAFVQSIEEVIGGALNQPLVKPGQEIYTLLQTDKKGGIKLLFEQYSKKLFYYATNKWKIEEDAAWDLIYKTIYKVADKSGDYQFESEGGFISFLFKVLINNIRDYLRHQKVKNNSTTEVELSDTIINNHQVPQSEAIPVSYPLKVLQEQLDKLEDWERILLLMRTQDIPYSEIARYVNKPENQLKTYYSRLKKQLMERVNTILEKENQKENA